MTMKPARILIVRTDRIGDVVLSTPVISNVRAAFPRAHIEFMCAPATREVLEGNPWLNGVIVFDKLGKHKSLMQSVRFALQLRKKDFDWALVLHPTQRVHIITYFARIPMRIGWDKKRGWLLTHRLLHRKQEGLRHESDYTLDILRALDVPIIETSTFVPVKGAAIQSIEKILRNANVTGKFIVIHPSASCPSKRWPAAYFSQLAGLLREKTALPVAVIASAGERACGDEIVAQNKVLDLRGLLTLSETAALLQKCALFISCDSGPVHIAASFNTPVISIFGRSDPGLSPARWKPLGESSVYIHKDVGCQTCLAHNCQKDFLCLKEIKPAEVLEKALTLLARDS